MWPMSRLFTASCKHTSSQHQHCHTDSHHIGEGRVTNVHIFSWSVFLCCVMWFLLVTVRHFSTLALLAGFGSDAL